MTRVSPNAAKSFLGEVARGAYQLESMGGADVDESLAIIRRYEDLQLGLADASIVVLAARHGTDKILTLDERHFRAIVGGDGRRSRSCRPTPRSLFVGPSTTSDKVSYVCHCRAMAPTTARPMNQLAGGLGPRTTTDVLPRVCRRVSSEPPRRCELSPDVKATIGC